MILIGSLITIALMVPCAPYLAIGRFRYGARTLLCIIPALLTSWIIMPHFYLGFAQSAGLQPNSYGFETALFIIDVIYGVAAFILFLQFIDAFMAKKHIASFGSSTPIANRSNAQHITFEMTLYGMSGALGLLLSNNEGPHFMVLSAMPVAAFLPRLILGLLVKRATGNLMTLGNPASLAPSIAGLAPMPKSTQTGGINAIISRRPISLQALEKD